MTQETFTARRERLQHSFELPLPANVCRELFTPAGEEAWVADWKPDYVYPSGGETELGMVFVTSHDGETTFWQMTDYDPILQYVRYARLTPGSRATIVEVRCETLDAARTRVHVAYTLTGLSDEGNAAIGTFAAGFAKSIDGWRTSILTWLKTSEKRR